MKEGIGAIDRLIPVDTAKDILPAYRGTPVGKLLEYHNLDRPFEPYTRAELLIGMCMDSRKHLHIPENFAFILRTGGANLRYSEFKISYAIGVGGVEAIALLGHNTCGMVNLAARRDIFIQGLMDNAGWSRAAAEEHFMNYAPMYEIGNEIDFLISEAARLNARYPKIPVAPLLYRVENNRIYQIKQK